MSLLLGRYKGEPGYIISLPNSACIGFKTNTTLHKLLPNEIESGEHIIPVPFYGNREAYVIRQQANGMFVIRLMGVSVGNRGKRFTVGAKQMSWYLLDSSDWEYTTRAYVRKKYGLTNFENNDYMRNTI